MNVPFLELKPAYEELRDELDAAYRRVMDSGWYLLGRELEAFEQEYAVYCEADQCVGVGNGLDALHLALRACGIGAGDEVIVPSHTFIATWLAVTHAGATPVPVEPDIATYNIDVNRIEAAITPRTKAIIPVHLYGQPADVDPIMEIAERHQLIILEDAAQAQGARYKGRRVGSLGHIAAHSFYPGKNLGAFADAGAITTNDPQLGDRVRMLRNYGSRVKYQYDLPGFNSRMDELQAAFLRVRLGHLDDWNSRRQRIAETYLSELANTSCVLPSVLTDTVPVWHLFVIRHEDRDRLLRALSERGIGTLIHYPIPIHRSDVYASMSTYSLPLADRLAAGVLSLPMSPHLDVDDAREIGRIVCEYFAHRHESSTCL